MTSNCAGARPVARRTGEGEGAQRLAGLLDGVLSLALSALKWLAPSLAPFLAGHALVMVLTLGCPRIVHLLEPPHAQAHGIVGPAVSPQAVEKKLLEMLPPPPLPGIEKSGIEK